MRHRISFRKLSRTHEHRRALLRNLVTSLFLHERIETTVAKAKEARRVAERMITFAKRGDISARRPVDSYVFDPAAIGPHCGTVKLTLFSDKAPAKGDVRVVDPKIVQQIWDDFAAYRAGA